MYAVTEDAGQWLSGTHVTQQLLVKSAAGAEHRPVQSLPGKMFAACWKQ